MRNALISIVLPVFDEEKGIKKFLDEQLMPEVLKLKYETEIIVVDDGSKDNTLQVIDECEIKNKTIFKVVAFSRNFGKEVALSAGLNYSCGDAVIMIDADGQHPVEAISKMIEKWEKGAEIVTAVRGQNTTKHKFGSKMYYLMIKTFGYKNLVVGAMDYRLLDRMVVDEYNRFTEHNRLARGLVDWLGFRQEYVTVKTRGRLAGEPTYNKKMLMRLAIDSLISSSRTPLMIFGWVGVVITIASVLLGLFILIEQYILKDPLNLDWSGTLAMSVFVSFLVGLVLISQAMTALYISQIHTEAKNRPLYVVDKKRSKGIFNKD